MKLAESLTQIKDLKGKIAKLQAQLYSKTTVMKLTDDQEIPDNNAVIKELKELSDKLAGLKTKVVATNVHHGLTQKIHELQEAKFKVTLFEHLADTEQKTVQLHGGGYGQSQEKYEVHATFDVEKAKEMLAVSQKALRDIDIDLQRQNWLIDLVN